MINSYKDIGVYFTLNPQYLFKQTIDPTLQAYIKIPSVLTSEQDFELVIEALVKAKKEFNRLNKLPLFEIDSKLSD